MSRLVSAELRKLTRRRATMAWSFVLTSGLMAAFYAFQLLRHGGADGGASAYAHSLEGLATVGSVAAILVGCAAGYGDRAAGVFRDLVATGRSRRALFAARVPAVLALAVALGVTAAAFSAVLAALTGAAGEPGISLGLALRGVAWSAATLAFDGLLALGVASLLGSAATSIGVVLGWQLAASVLLMQVSQLGALRWWIPLSAIDRLEPGATPAFPHMPVAVAVVVLAVWAAVWLAVGSWRTETVDA